MYCVFSVLGFVEVVVLLKVACTPVVHVVIVFL